MPSVRQYIAFGFGLLLAMPQALAQRAVDAAELSVSGVKLGMGWNEARQAASEFMQVPAATLAAFNLNNPLSRRYEPMGFRIRQPNVELMVTFSPDPAQSGMLRVSAVKYELAWSQENAEQMRQAALQRYGAPSNGLEGVTLEWCAHPNENLGLGCSMMGQPGQEGQAVLKTYNTTLTLEDTGAHLRIQRHLDSQKTTTPRF